MKKRHEHQPLAQLVDIARPATGTGLWASATRSVLEMVASGAPLEETLTAIVALVEDQVPGSHGVIVGCDSDRVVEVVVAPTLPPGWWQATIDGRNRRSGSAFMPMEALGAPDVVAAAMGGQARADGSHHGVGVCSSFPLEVDGGLAGTMAVYSDRTPACAPLLLDCAQLAAVALSRLRAEHRLHARLSMDATTGLPNGRDVESRITAALERRRNGVGAFVGVLCLEVPRLAEYNATFGREVGDDILRYVAAAATRHADPMTVALRVAGGRFLLITEGVSDVGDIANMAHQLAHAASGPVVVAGQPIIVDAAVGVAVAGDSASSPSQLLAEAQAATVQAQRSRLDQVAIFDPAVAREASDRLIVELGLQRALSHGELTVHYQPIHAVAGGALVGAEALLRWSDPETGLRHPDEFVSVAETSGLIRRVTRWVLGQACQQIARWQHSAAGPPLSVSVNVSATELHDPGLVADVREAVTAAGIRPALLCLELTETAVMDDPAAALEVLATLKAIGVRLAIDDFGAGYSSLTYLRRLPIDYVKIDRSFIDAMLRSAKDEAIVAAVIDLMTTLGLPVVAEGVETVGHLEALRRMKCRYAQGFHWSPAVPVEDFNVLLGADAGLSQKN